MSAPPPTTVTPESHTGSDYPEIELTLPIDGMTCASCVNRVERYLRKTDGVIAANVNLATEQARVRYDPTLVGRDELNRAVVAAGYAVRPDAVAAEVSGTLDAAAEADAQRRQRETRQLGWEAAAAVATGLVMMALTLWSTPLMPSQQGILAQVNLPDPAAPASTCGWFRVVDPSL